MVEVLQAKLEQHPRLTEAIAKRGGADWLENCTSITNAQDQQWQGKGKESVFIQALSEAYIYVVTKAQQTTVQTQQDLSQQTALRPTNPLSQLEPINAAVAEHMKKDIAMAQLATQFIGKSAAPPGTPSSFKGRQSPLNPDR